MSAARKPSSGPRNGRAAPRAPQPASSDPQLLLRDALAARYEAVLASTLDPIITIDAFGIVQSASNSLERVLGWRPDEIVGKNINILMPEPHHTAHDSYLAKYRNTGITNILGRTREFEAVRRDGTKIPIELSVSRVDIPGQEQPLFTGIVHDISERRAADLELGLIHGLALDVAQARDMSSAMVASMRRICELTGWDYGEAWFPDARGSVLRARPVWYAHQEGLEPFVEATLQRQFTSGEGLPGRVWKQRRAEWITDLSDRRLFCRVDAAREVAFTAALAVPILSGGEAVAVIVFCMRERPSQPERLLQLVSGGVAPLGAAIQRKRAEDALFESERRTREMLETMHLGAVTINPQGRITFCNDFLLGLTRWRREEVLGADWFDLFIPAADREPLRAKFAHAFRIGTMSPHMEIRIVTRERRVRLMAVTATLVRDVHGGTVAATCLGIDVTEQRTAQEELARHRDHLQQLVKERTRSLEETHEKLRTADRLASIGTLAAGLGHDMNNVLLPVRCRLDALTVGELDDPVREHLAAVGRSIDYLQHLADGLHLLALDPAEDGAADEATDLSQWWEQVGTLLARSVPKQVRLSTSWATDLPPLAVKPHRLTQAVLNLLVNAGEAVDARDGKIRLEAEADAANQVVRVSVIDNGIGMTEDVCRRALDPFFTTKKRGLGTGLGLSLVQGVVRSAGGSVEIHSTPGKGTTISLMIPVAATPAAANAGEAAGRGVAALCIGDPRTRGLIASLLRSSGFETRETDPNRIDGAAICVVEPSPETLAIVSRSPGVAVVVGEPAPAWDACNPIVIAADADFEIIRNAVSEAARRAAASRPTAGNSNT